MNARFDLPTPGVVALFGRSGCGKSTLVDVLAGLLGADAGRIVLDGTVLLDTERGVKVPPERRRMGYVFQEARLFPHLRVAGNLRYALRRAVGPNYVTLESVVELLALAPLLQRRVHQLSGGERQRVAIGRALLSQPRLLLLDEPLAGLDVARRAEVLPYLELLRDRLSIPMVYVTHDFDEVLRLATYVVLLEAGTVVAQGGVGAMSLEPRLRALIGPDAVGAVIDGVLLGHAAAGGLGRVRVGQSELLLQTAALPVGAPVRVQLLARDLIISTKLPTHLSVRNALPGVITAIVSDDEYSDLVTLDIGPGPGATCIMARVTKAATRELGLTTGLGAWALVKAVSLRGHSIAGATALPARSLRGR